MAAAVQALDEIIREYLLFRGFANTLKIFEAELKNDRDKSFRVHKIVEQLTSFVQQYDLGGIREYWSYLKRRFFSRLDSVHLHNAYKLEKCLYRFYLVNAVQTSRPDKVTDFFEKMASELQNQADWKEWFVLPFLKNPEQNPSLEMYFSPLWQETFPLSLHNFLNAIFQSMPLPRLLKFDAERIISEKLKRDNNHLHEKIVLLQQEISILQENQEKKFNGTLKELNDSLPKKVVLKEPKTNGKELTTLIPKRFRKNKADNQMKRKSQLLEQDATSQTENSQSKPALQTNNLEEENKDFDMPPGRTKSESTQPQDFDPNQSFGKESSLAINKQDEKSSQNSKTGSIPEDDGNLTFKNDNYESEIVIKDKRSLSLSAKTTMRPEPIKRANSNTQFSNYNEMSLLGRRSATLKESSENPFLVLSEEVYSEHRSPIVQCDFSHSGNMVSSVDLDGVVKVWKHRPLSTVATIMSKSAILCTEWASKNDRLLLLGTSNGKIRLYNTETKTAHSELSTETQNSRVVSLACSPSCTSFVCSATVETKHSLTMTSVLKHALTTEPDRQTDLPGQGTLLLWDLKTMKLERHLPLGINKTRVNCIAYNHNGTLLVTGEADGMIRVYDTRSYDCLMNWRAHTSQVKSVQFSVDETSVFSLGRDNQFLQWSLRKMGLITASIAAHDGMCGPRDHVVATSSKTRPALFTRLFTFDSKGEHLLTCAPTSGIIYKYNENDNVLSQVFSIGESKSHVTSVDWNNAGDSFTCCVTGCQSGLIRMTTLMKR
ncbi:WD repeat-containing protein 91-like [Dendronephthya gigantea]|uniref:WD repeat-containing protein 91-like n=1 Tax=Dendronephthya gigantea TaxID=151771 RepID=UPI001069B676|nr:WD repeat-containing protein 91-like [Dendronephthya gigantea]